MQWYITKRIYFMEISYFNHIYIYIYIGSCYIFQNHYCMNNSTQRQPECFNMELRTFKYNFNTNITPALCNLTFYSQTIQLMWQYLTYLYNDNIMLCFNVFIKHFMVCQYLVVFSIEEIKEAQNSISCRNVEIALHSKIDDGFHVVTMHLLGYISNQFYIPSTL